MYLTDSEEARLLTSTMTGTRMALMTAMGTESTAGTEVTGGGYVRAAVTPGSPTGGAISNGTSILFLDLPACVLHGWELWSTDNLRRWFGYWAPTVAVFAPAGFTTSAPHGLQNGDRVVFVLGQAPAGFVANTAYFVRDVASTTFKLSTTSGGTAVAPTASGSTTFGRVLVIPSGESFQIPPGALQISMD